MRQKMNDTERKRIKPQLLKCAKENENKGTFTGYVIVSSVCRAAVERIEELEETINKLREQLALRYSLEDKIKELEQQIEQCADLERENEEMKKGLGCETCQIHLEYMGLNNKINQLLKDKGDLTDELKEWKDEWQEQVQKAIDEGWERTKLTGRVRELEQQIEKMKCCYNCSKWNDGECSESPEVYTMADFECENWELKE